MDLSEPKGLGALANHLLANHLCGAAVTLAMRDETIQGTIVGTEGQDGPNRATRWPRRKTRTKTLLGFSLRDKGPVGCEPATW